MLIEVFALAATVSLSTTYLLIRLAHAVGWVDAPCASDADRKLQPAAVPVVGGAAILFGLITLEVDGRTPLGGALIVGDVLAEMTFELTMIWPSLLAAFSLGLVDDLRRGGLHPALKFAGQMGVGLVVACSVSPMEPIYALACATFVALSLNVWNTFDNADGAATGVGGICLLSLGSPAAAPLLGFLPWNVRARGGAAAYLGDSGSHLLGCLIILHPDAWPLMALPAMDLLRVSVLRVQSGQAPWHGDRRHLAHRLQDRGLSPLVVALCLWGVAAIACVVPGWLGFGLTAVAFLGLVLASRPCPGTEVP